MKIEVIENLSNEAYHNGEKWKPFWSSSNIKNYLISPKEAHYQKFEAENKTSDAMTFGSQMHDLFASKCTNAIPFEWNVFEPPVNEKTGNPYGKETLKYKAALEQIENPISADDYEKINELWEAVENCETYYLIEEALTHGTPELSVFADDENGLKLKARYDLVTDEIKGSIFSNSIIDYKTIAGKDFTARGFNFQIAKFKYDISIAMYQYIEFLRTGIWKRFYIVWLKKDAPYDVVIDDVTEYGYIPTNGGTSCLAGSGGEVFDKLLIQHKQCLSTGNYPGLSAQFEGGICKSSPRYAREFNIFETE